MNPYREAGRLTEELKQAISALKTAHERLADIIAMADNAREWKRDAITLYTDSEAIQDIRCAMLNAQLVLRLHSRRHPECRLADGTERAA